VLLSYNYNNFALIYSVPEKIQGSNLGKVRNKDKISRYFGSQFRIRVQGKFRAKHRVSI
jgi:hypothetical protein